MRIYLYISISISIYIYPYISFSIYLYILEQTSYHMSQKRLGRNPCPGQCSGLRIYYFADGSNTEGPGVMGSTCLGPARQLQGFNEIADSTPFPPRRYPTFTLVKKGGSFGFAFLQASEDLSGCFVRVEGCRLLAAAAETSKSKAVARFGIWVQGSHSILVSI